MDVREYLRRNPEAQSLSGAIHRLVKPVRLRTPAGATEYLKVSAFATQRRIAEIDSKRLWEGRLGLVVETMHLYQTLFPREYKASLAPIFSTAREQEFYRLINDRMFPIPLDRAEEEPEFFWPGIPLTSKQPHVWEDCRFEDMETVFKLVHILCEHRRPGKWRTFGLDKEPAAPLVRVPWSLFVYGCRVDESPMKYMPFAFYLVHYKTGNPWFDVAEEGFMGISWNEENIALLYRHRAQASHLLATLNKCNDWLDASPDNPRRVVELWNLCSTMNIEEEDFTAATSLIRRRNNHAE